MVNSSIGRETPLILPPPLEAQLGLLEFKGLQALQVHQDRLEVLEVPGLLGQLEWLGLLVLLGQMVLLGFLDPRVLLAQLGLADQVGLPDPLGRQGLLVCLELQAPAVLAAQQGLREQRGQLDFLVQPDLLEQVLLDLQGFRGLLGQPERLCRRQMPIPLQLCLHLS